MNIRYFTNKIRATYKVAILLRDTTVNLDSIENHYLPHINVSKKDIIVLGLKYDNGKTVTATYAKAYLLNNIFSVCEKMGVSVILIADSLYFKYATNTTSTKSALNHVASVCKNHPAYDNMFRVLPIPNYKSFFYNPDLSKNVALNLTALPFALKGMPVQEGMNFNGVFTFPEGKQNITKKLKKLLKHPTLCVDIEAFDLSHFKAGVGTISFSHTKDRSVAFYVDYMPIEVYNEYYSHHSIVKRYPNVEAVRIDNQTIKKILYKFILKFKGKWVYHNMAYDAKLLIYELFMKRVNEDRKNMLYGLEQLCGKFDDTQTLTFLALNSCASIKVNLKANTIEYMGNYGIDVTDITVVKPQKLRIYNAQDTCATMYLREKHKPAIVENKQQYLYSTILKESAITLLQCELEGMGMRMDRVDTLTHTLKTDIKKIRKSIKKLSCVRLYIDLLTDKFFGKRNQKLVNAIKYSSVPKEKFNAGSGVQLVGLLYSFLNLPVFDMTAKKNPSTDKGALKKLLDFINVELNKRK